MHERIKVILRPIKRQLWAMLGKDMMFKADVRVATEFHGTEYGGFAILKESLDSSSVVLSFGIGEDASFDEGIIQKYDCRVHAFDPTPKSIAWVKSHMRSPKFDFHGCAISDIDGVLRLFLPKCKNHVSASLQRGQHTSEESVAVPAKRLATILGELGLSRISLLKMDVEGAEYRVLNEYFSDFANPLPEQLALEFHHFYPEFGSQATNEAIKLLRDRGYQIGWVSPTHHELLFIRRETAKI